uniref:C-type lectin domain-containing protein n=1 Tax=Caenorhabditis tropicalis TaxID=1561998 RepID=A0A1I7UKL5_9PELO
MKSLILLLSISALVLAKVEIAKVCPEGWTWFERSRGGWCMKVFSDSGLIANAEAKCAALGAVVSGSQNAKEIDWMLDTAVNTLKMPTNTALFIGAKRTQRCLKEFLTKDCSQLNSFSWTDNLTVGISGFRWLAGEPNNSGGNQDCIQLILDRRVMDDITCGLTVLGGYTCGKVATFE